MALTRSYKESIQAELKKDPVFRNALFAEAIDALAENEVPEALSMLRDIVHATITFKGLAEKTGISEKSLHRMLGQRGNPTAQNIGKILKTLKLHLGLQLSIAA